MDGDLQRRLGQNLRQYRLQRGLSQEQLAEVWGWSRGYLSELERGRRNPSLRTVEYVAGLMSIDPLVLLSMRPRLRLEEPGGSVRGRSDNR